MRHLLVIILAFAPCAGAYGPKKVLPRSRPAKAAAPSPPSFDAAAINNPAQNILSPGDRGSAVVRAQILLSRAHFSCGEIDGHFGNNLGKTLAAFQKERHLAESDKVDSDIWAALNGDSAPALISYTIAAEDVAGPFVQIPKEVPDQAKLPAMNYSSPVEALAEKFHSSQTLLRALNPGVNFAAGQKIVVPNVLVMPLGRAARLEVRKGESSVRAYDDQGKLMAFYVATAGSTHDPLPLGNWKVNGVARNPKFHYNPKLFWDASDKDAKATLPPGPNNPVGLVWIDLSYEHTGIHGTSEPSRVGHAFSHGCIRLTNWDAVELAGMVRPGTPVALVE